MILNCHAWDLKMFCILPLEKGALSEPGFEGLKGLKD